MDHADDATIVGLARRLHASIREALPETPLEHVEFAGRRVLVKREDLQVTGSFKVRGALLRLAQLDASRARFGVVCASAGNHGKGVAWAAGRMGILATVVVPRGTPAVKRRGILDYGADLIVYEDEPGYDAAERHAKELAKTRGATFLSAFDDPFVQAGNGGTLALDILAQAPHVARLLIPVGGGGMASGMGPVVHELHPWIEIVGVQSSASPAMSRSLRDGRAHLEWPAAETLAEGLEGGVAESTFAICRRHLARMIEVSEPAIADAIVRARRDLGVPLEGSAAVVLAAIVDGQAAIDDDTVVVLSGGNVDPERVRALEAAAARV